MQHREVCERRELERDVRNFTIIHLVMIDKQPREVDFRTKKIDTVNRAGKGSMTP